jgi:2-polyprenyl-3-methyl-5-hydroxy-6-metoxy-1,4-benzoquinol methylase
MSHTHEEAQHEELAFWGTPGAELGEQLKQLTYAKYLKLDFIHDGSSPYVIDKTGLNIMDIGGGPVSLLLKTIANKKLVVDPCGFPEWVDGRYKANGVQLQHKDGETLNRINNRSIYDEVWMYNVLQHTDDPKKIFENIYKVLKPGGTFRFLDWIDTPTNVAHPISLSYNDLSAWLSNYDQPLLQTDINENGAVGTIAYGVFKK